MPTKVDGEARVDRNADPLLNPPPGYSIERVDDAEKTKWLRHLHNCVFPIAYPPSFYKKVQNGEIEGRLLRDDQRGEYVGCVTWKISKESSTSTDSNNTCSTPDEAEILTLGVKVLRRRRGLGSHLLRQALSGARSAGANNVRLCLQVGDEEAERFYATAAGFARTGRVIKGYYGRRVDPPDALEMALDLRKWTAE